MKTSRSPDRQEDDPEETIFRFVVEFVYWKNLIDTVRSSGGMSGRTLKARVRVRFYWKSRRRQYLGGLPAPLGNHQFG